MNEYIDAFQNALSKIDWDSMPIGFQNFPSGSCGNISDILGEYLRSKGFNNIEYICGKTNKIRSHAWIEIEGYVVDLTAHQFNEVSEPIVSKKPSEWHAQFEEVTRRSAGYSGMKGPAVCGLRKVHNKILELIDV